MGSTLTRRELNRATLARQMLLARESTTALRAIERLVGLQAQQPWPPYVGLWTRLAGFQREELTRLLVQRKVVRASLMRCTLHLMSAKDYLALRPALQPALTLAMRSALRGRTDGLALDALVVAGRRFFSSKPRTFEDLRTLLRAQFPHGDERAMGYAVRTQVPLVQVATDAPLGFGATSDFTVAESWLRKPLGTDARPHTLVRRYLAGFGPASAADIQTWSGLPGLREVLEQMRPQLTTFRDERGRELFDLPAAPRPSDDTIAPARFVPDFDNLVLAHADRSRIVADEHRGALVTRNLQVKATFLVDGFVAGTWSVERTKAAVTLHVEPFGKLSRMARAELVGEGEDLLRFVAPETTAADVKFTKS